MGFGMSAFLPVSGISGTAYVANEQAATISVIDTDTQTITQTIGLGSDRAIPGTPQPDGPSGRPPPKCGYCLECSLHNPGCDGAVAFASLAVPCAQSERIIAVDTARLP